MTVKKTILPSLSVSIFRPLPTKLSSVLPSTEVFAIRSVKLVTSSVAIALVSDKTGSKTIIQSLRIKTWGIWRRPFKLVTRMYLFHTLRAEQLLPEGQLLQHSLFYHFLKSILMWIQFISTSLLYRYSMLELMWTGCNVITYRMLNNICEELSSRKWSRN